MKKTTMLVFRFQKYGRFWNLLLGHFIKHNKPLIFEECFAQWYSLLLRLSDELSIPMLDNETAKEDDDEKVFQEDAISSPKCDFKCLGRRIPIILAIPICNFWIFEIWCYNFSTSVKLQMGRRKHVCVHVKMGLVQQFFWRWVR